MENSFKQILEKNKEKNIKLIFKYPQFSGFTFKRGKVIETFNDCFSFQEVDDGEVTYSYQYLVEVREL